MNHASVREEEDPANHMECEVPRLTSRLRKAKMLGTSNILYVFILHAFADIPFATTLQLRRDPIVLSISVGNRVSVASV